MQVPTAGRTRARVLLTGAAVCVGLAAWLILGGRGDWGGAAVAGAGLLSIAGAMLARRDRAAVGRMLDSFVDRAFDGCVFGSIAWTTRASDPATSLGALIALAAGFLGAYIRARGESLDYQVEESLGTRGLRYGVVAIGLAGGWLTGAVYTAVGVASLAALVRATQVAKEERA